MFISFAVNEELCSMMRPSQKESYVGCVFKETGCIIVNIIRNGKCCINIGSIIHYIACIDIIY